MYLERFKDNIKLKDGMHDFNFISVINKKKRLPFRKFYIYHNTEIDHYTNEDRKIKILEVTENPKLEGTQIAVYIDPNGNLSFMIFKPHSRLSNEEVLEKAESTPPHRVKTFKFGNSLYVFGVLRFRYANMQTVNLAVGYDKSLTYQFKYLFSKKIRKFFREFTNKFFLPFHIGYAKIPLQDLFTKYNNSSEINNPLYIKSVNNNNLNYYYQLKFRGFDKYNRNHYVYSSKRYNLKKKEITTFLRKSISGQLVLVITDHLKFTVPLKEKIGKFLSIFTSKKKDVYFEKFSKGASELAFEVFKVALEAQDEDALFILSKENERFKELERYYGKDRVIAHNSIRAFKYIFKAKRLISSDLSTHILRSLYDNSKLLKKKILNTDKKIFLQHGISLATNVFERGYYNPRVPIAPDYIVTNSDLESFMFHQYTDYQPSQLIQEGTPNLDLYVKNTYPQDEITFILTWRPWDLTGKIEKDSYLDRYLQFIELITNNAWFKDKNINIILHPKAREILEEQFPQTYENFKQYLYLDDIKDALLKSKVVITDYSSISFYAFTGGSNIIFFWGDKEKAESEYGAPNILQSYNAFGDIVNTIDSKLLSTIQLNYSQQQNSTYIERFKNLVEYTEGNNSLNVYNRIKGL
ncbi:CDP-glycerol glycerophosphotransferase family protein [Staphylococcus pettenkoferi]|uniref:CDP-glycerol glycerophosphotransferase family protein n=2 Tax=Staphylococcus pettenkoferi TaxID=170573 RepID=UPI0011A5B5B5|nr:CDP-glycerol glycerophosphotransferase family protein [Staphylococcus pettenkoferi]